MYEVIEVVIQAVLYFFSLPINLDFLGHEVTLGSLFIGTSLIGLVSYAFHRINK